MTKAIPFEGNKYTIRGNEVHNLCEKTINYGAAYAQWPEQHVQIRDNLRAVFEMVMQFRKDGWHVATEVMAATDGMGHPVDYWSHENNFTRSKIDLVCITPDRKKGIVIDWKTGKPGADDLQLHLNVMALAPTYGIRDWQVFFVYVDKAADDPAQSEEYKVSLEVEQPLLWTSDRVKEHIYTASPDAPVLTSLPTLELIGNMRDAYRTGQFPPNPTAPYCRSCKGRGFCPLKK